MIIPDKWKQQGMDWGLKWGSVRLEQVALAEVLLHLRWEEVTHSFYPGHSLCCIDSIHPEHALRRILSRKREQTGMSAATARWDVALDLPCVS